MSRNRQIKQTLLNKCLALPAGHFFNGLLFIVLILLFAASQSFAQQVFTSSELLASVSNNQVDSIIVKKQVFPSICTGKITLEWMNWIYERKQTNGRLSQQEYLLRMSFNNKALQEVHQKYAQHNIDFFDLRVEQLEEERFSTSL